MRKMIMIETRHGGRFYSDDSDEYFRQRVETETGRFISLRTSTDNQFPGWWWVRKSEIVGFGEVPVEDKA